MRYACKSVNGRIEYVHRLVAAEMLGRALLPGEEVHHRNGDKLDNRPENLCVTSSRREHFILHRLSHCQRGHEMTDENIIVHTQTGQRNCRQCHRDRQRRYYHDRKAAA